MPAEYQVVYEARVKKEDIPFLPASVAGAIKRAIEERLMTNPLHYGKPLRYELKGYRRIRIADYRIIYRIDEKAKTVYISAIKHRKEVYKS